MCDNIDTIVTYEIIGNYKTYKVFSKNKLHAIIWTLQM